MKVKLLKKIRSRFAIDYNRENFKLNIFTKRYIRISIIFDRKTKNEYSYYDPNNSIEFRLFKIYEILNNPFFSFTRRYNKKIQKRIQNQTFKKYNKLSI